MKVVARALFVVACLASPVFAAPEKSKVWRFDFTPDPVSPRESYVAVGAKTVYSSKTGHGWAREWGEATKDATAVDPLARGAIGAPDSREAEFRADVPNGAYEVEIIAGVASPREGRLGICVAAEDKVVIPPPGIGGWGKVDKRTVPAMVTDGRLDIKFFLAGKGGAYRLNLFALSIRSISDARETEKIAESWAEAPDFAELGKRKIVINGKTFTELGRRRETRPGQWLEKFAGRGALLFTRDNPGDILNYSAPKEKEVTDRLKAFAAPGETQPFYCGVYALGDLKDVRVKIQPLVRDGDAIHAENIEFFTVTCLSQSPTERPSSVARVAPELLEKNVPFDLARGETQPIYLTVKVPENQPPGEYSGTVRFAPLGARPFSLKLSLRVLPLAPADPPGKAWMLYTDNSRWFEFNRTELFAEIDDMAAHGINSLKVGVAPLQGAYVETDGKIVDVDYGLVGEAVRRAVRNGMRGPLVFAPTNAIVWWLDGWDFHKEKQSDYSVAATPNGGVLKVTNAAPEAFFAAWQSSPADMPVGEPVRLAVLYKKSGGGEATAALTFRTVNRAPYPAAPLTVDLAASNGEWRTVAIAARVPAGHPENLVSLSYRGGPGELEIKKIELVGRDGATNHVCNPEFTRSARPFDTNKPWPPEFRGNYADAIRAYLKASREMGVQDVYIEGKDEAGNDPKTEFSELEELRAAKAAGAKTWCNLSLSLANKNYDVLDAVCFYADLLGDRKGGGDIVKSFQTLGKKVYLIAAGTYPGQDYDLMPNRYGVGYFFWLSGADGSGIWTFQRFWGDPFNDFDGEFKDHCLVVPPREKGGAPIPTIAWEGIREGVRDYRYVHALENALARADQNNPARRLGETVLGFVRDSVPWYNEFSAEKFDNREADNLRWLAAWATMRLNGQWTAQKNASPEEVVLTARKIPAERIEREPPVLCPFTADSPRIDGALDDPVWATATEITGFKVNGQPEIVPAAETRAYLTHDRRNLYIGFKCFEPAMGQLKMTERERDGGVFDDESVEIFLDTTHDAFSFYQLCFNAAGSKFDMKCAGGVNYGENIFNVAYGKKKIRDAAWNGEWTVKTARFSDRWEAEVVIPFATVGRESDLWGVLLGRNRRIGERACFANKSIGPFHQPEKFAKMLLTGARSGKGILREWRIPAALYGQAEAIVRVEGQDKFKAVATTIGDHGEKTGFSATADSGTVALPYFVETNAAAIQFEVSNMDGETMYRCPMAIAPPPPLEIVASRKVLGLDNPAANAEFTVKINLSAASRTGATLEFQLLKDGALLKRVNAELDGENYLLGLRPEALTEGLYVLRATVSKQNAKTLVGDCAFAVVPPFINPKDNKP